MKLTGKVKEDFSYKYNMSNFNEYSEVLQNALIIEFFDSVGMIIIIKRHVMPLGEVEWYYIITGDNGAHLNNHVSEESRSLLDCRKEITTKAIIHANKIYNEKMP